MQVILVACCSQQMCPKFIITKCLQQCNDGMKKVKIFTAMLLGTVRKFPHLPKYGHARILFRPPPLPPTQYGQVGQLSECHWQLF